MQREDRLMALIVCRTCLALYLGVSITGLSINAKAIIDNGKGERLTNAKGGGASTLDYRAARHRWAIAFDNDVFVPGRRDQDYTYGLNLTRASRNPNAHSFSLVEFLQWTDRLLGISKKSIYMTTYQSEYGLFGFTPEDISRADAIPGDRPYASMLYTSAMREHHDTRRNVAWSSSVTLGIMGLGVVGELQDGAHDIAGGEQPRGWDNQISDGGEITARYKFARQALLGKGGNHREAKMTLHASAGYITEAALSMSGRIGTLHTPWVSFSPELTTYGEKSAPVTSAAREHYFWGGVSLKARAYNAFLQGQFRDSVVEYDRGDLNSVIAEVWMGYTLSLSKGYRLTYLLRGHTSELKRGSGDRDVVWGGIQLARTF